MSREQIVRDTAYAIWEAEGKPDGRAADHWRQAEARVAASIAPAAPKSKAPAKGKVTTKPAEAAQDKPPAKAAATKAATTKSTPKSK